MGKRRPLRRGKSKKIFKKNTGVNALNNMDRYNFRGGIRL